MFDALPDGGEWHYCPRCGVKALLPKGRLGPFQGLQCPRCLYILVPVHPKGMDVFGTATMYERGNEEANAIIRDTNGWERSQAN